MPHRPVVVIKLGSNALSDAAGHIDLPFLDSVVQQVRGLIDAGRRPVLVSSGAVSCGMARMGLTRRPSTISETQALAAIGQADLAHRWQEACARVGIVAAQVLLTQDAFDDRQRYLNLTGTFRALFARGVVPVVNENDTVAVDELTVGDNDRLSALVASQLGAGLLVLLTDIAGYYDRDPKRDPTAELVRQIPPVTPAMIAAAGGGGARGRGGMRSKLEAVRLATGAGVETVIANAREPEAILRIVRGEAVGSRAAAAARSGSSSRRRWLALARAIRGTLIVDAGAVQALCERGRSLLSAGIVAVEGSFARGDTVAIAGPEGRVVARGMAGLSAAELRAIAGLRTDQARKRLGYALPKAAVHRDDLLLV